METVIEENADDVEHTREDSHEHDDDKKLTKEGNRGNDNGVEVIKRASGEAADDKELASRGNVDGVEVIKRASGGDDDVDVTKEASRGNDDGVEVIKEASGEDGVSQSSNASGEDGVSQSSNANGDDGVSPSSNANGDDAVSPSSNASGEDAVSPSSNANGDDAVSPSSNASGEDAVSPSSNASGEDGVSQSSNANGEDAVSQSSNASGGYADDASLISDRDSKEPFALFIEWYKDACEATDIQAPKAMSLATSTSTGRPSCRMVGMAECNSSGIVFYTDHNSRKGKELIENPHASLLFYWVSQDKGTRQVRIEGTVEKVSEVKSAKAFRSLHRNNQINGLSFNQSAAIESRETLLERFKETSARYSDQSLPIPRPEDWGGFVLVPEVFEFNQILVQSCGDRVVFRKLAPNEEMNPELTHTGDDGWVYEILCP